MSNTDIRVVPGPANYFSHPGSLARLDNFFTPEQLSRAVWIYGERAIEGARPFLPESFNAPGAKRLLFKATCTERDVPHLPVPLTHLRPHETDLDLLCLLLLEKKKKIKNMYHST
ncbi:hypothetical protein ACPRR5_24445, partial [Enterobacter asburiae]